MVIDIAAYTNLVCELFADASLRRGEIGFGCAARLRHLAGFVMPWPSSEPANLGGKLTSVKTVTNAELIALATAFDLVPAPCRRVIAYTDLDWVPDRMAVQVQSFDRRIGSALNALRRAAEGRQVAWRIVDRRDSLYRHCHATARREAISVAGSK